MTDTNAEAERILRARAKALAIPRRQSMTAGAMLPAPVTPPADSV